MKTHDDDEKPKPKTKAKGSDEPLTPEEEHEQRVQEAEDRKEEARQRGRPE